MLAALLVASVSLAGGAPLGSVVLGVADRDGAHTDVVIVAPSGRREIVATIAHERGVMPEGALMPDGALVVTRTESAGRDGARVTVSERIDLGTGVRTPIAHDVLGAHAPTVARDGRALFVVREGEGAFAFVRAGERAPLARVTATWVTPARGDAATFLEVADGGARITRVGAGGREVLLTLPRGSYRSAAVIGGSTVIERGTRGGRAEIVLADRHGARVVHEGIAGMDPLPLGDGRVVLGSGEKRAAVLIAPVSDRQLVTVRLDPVRLDIGRAGVASPRAAALVNGAPVVVAWLDRGASLPGELWLVSARSERVELPEHALVEVYGIVASRGAP